MKKIITVLLISILTLSLLCPMLAHADKEDYSFSMHGENIAYNGRAYKSYLLPEGYHVMPHTVYDLTEAVCPDCSYRVSVCLKEADDSIIFFGNTYNSDFGYSEKSHPLYVTDEGKAHIGSFLQGEHGSSYLASKDKKNLSKLSSEFTTQLGLANEKITLDSLSLVNCTIYPILTYDTKEIICFQSGAIYILEDKSYAYVDYAELDASYFTSDGEFAYRKGSVEAVKLDGDILQMLPGVLSQMEHYSVEHQGGDDDYYYEPEDPEGAMAAFILMWIIFILIPPFVPIITGICLAVSSKIRHKKLWIALIIFGALWLICALAVLGIAIF